MKTERKIPWFNLLRLLGFVLFIYIIITIDFSQAYNVLKSANISFVLFAIFFQLVLLLLKAHRWFLLKKSFSNQSSWILVSAQFLESYAIGVFTPGRLGEFIKAGHESQKADKFSSFIRIVFERGYDLSFFFMFSGAFFLYFFRSDFIGWVILLLGFSLLIVSYLLMSFKYFGKLISKLQSKYLSKLTDFNQYSPYQSFVIFIISVLSNISTFISSYFLALSVDINQSFVNISGVVSIAGIINLLPITIMGMGTREASFLYFFKNFPESNVIAFSFLMFLIVQLGGALIAFVFSRLLFLLKK